MASNLCKNDNTVRKEKFEAFKSILKNLGYSNQFYATVKSPKFMNLNDMEREVESFIRAFSVPSRNLNLHTQYYGNEKRSAVLKIENDSCQVTFWDTGDLKFHKGFTKWQNDIFGDEDSSILKYYPDDQEGELEIYNYKGDKLYIIEKVIPVSVGDVRYNHDTSSEIVSFDVTFDFKKLIT